MALLLALAFLSLPAGAADIYRWVDENGKVHISDVVPEKYRGSAKRMDTGASEVSPENRAAAEARAAADRERARLSDEARAEAARRQAIQHPDPVALPRPPAESDCEKAHRLYKESVDCFAPFVTARGTVKEEAFNFCTSLPDPSPRCGPPKQESSER